jgi:hypothetical protein
MFLALFLTIAGFIIGLGAVTVIDLHGFFGRTSPYWTEATIRTHKITKPLIWIGTFLVLVGHVLLAKQGFFLEGELMNRIIILAILVLNGCFLSFVVSPELLKREQAGLAKELLPKTLQHKITASFVISFVGWWGLVILFVNNLV